MRIDRLGSLPRNRTRENGVLLIMLGASFFSISPIFMRAVEGYSALTIAFYRALAAMLIFAIFVATSSTGRKEIALILKDFRLGLWVIVLGIAMGVTSVLHTYAYLHTTVAKAVLLNNTAPIYAVVFGPLLLREPRLSRALTAVTVGVIGAVLIVDPASLTSYRPGEVQGILSAALSGATYGSVILLGRFLAGKVSAETRSFIATLVMTVMFLPFVINAPRGFFWQNVPVLAGLSVFSLAIPYYLIFSGQRWVTGQMSSIAALFEPVCGIFIGYLVYAEALSPMSIMGGILILLSIIIASSSEQSPIADH